MKRKLFFLGILFLVLHSIMGCTKNGPSTDPTIDSFKLDPPYYKADDSTTGIFNYTGIAYDSVPVIDSIYALSSSGYATGFHTILKTYTHQVSGKIRIKKLTSDSTYISLTRPVNDKYDTASGYSGMIFQTDTSYLKYTFVNQNDTVIWAKYSSNKINNIQSWAEFPDIYKGWIVIPNGDGKFVNGRWEIDYPTYGNYTSMILGNPLPYLSLIRAYHKYHLTCIKQQ